MLEEKSDDAVITKKDAAKMIGISTDTLDRMNTRKEGPPRMQISDRRVGYRMRDLRQWMVQKIEN